MVMAIDEPCSRKESPCRRAFLCFLWPGAKKEKQQRVCFAVSLLSLSGPRCREELSWTGGIAETCCAGYNPHTLLLSFSKPFRVAARHQKLDVG